MEGTTYFKACPMGTECKYKENSKHCRWYHHNASKLTDQEAIMRLVDEISSDEKFEMLVLSQKQKK